MRGEIGVWVAVGCLWLAVGALRAQAGPEDGAAAERSDEPAPTADPQRENGLRGGTRQRVGQWQEQQRRNIAEATGQAQDAPAPGKPAAGAGAKVSGKAPGSASAGTSATDTATATDRGADRGGGPKVIRVFILKDGRRLAAVSLIEMEAAFMIKTDTGERLTLEKDWIATQREPE